MKEEAAMTNVPLVGPDGGELVRPGPVQIRIVEDGTTTTHRLGLAEIRHDQHQPRAHR